MLSDVQHALEALPPDEPLIVLADFDGGNQRELFAVPNVGIVSGTPNRLFDIKWSDDGEWITYTQGFFFGQGGDEADIWIMRADGSVLVITVEYAPGASDPIHRHHAQAFVYVLEGSIEMQVKGGELVTLTPGQMFYEAPDDLHVVGRNASSTKPAKFIVVLVKDQGAPVLVPE